MWYLLFLIVFILIFFNCYSQGELREDINIATTSDRSFFIGANSNGFTIGFEKGKRIDGFRKWIYNVNFSYVKDPKEIRVENPYYNNQKRFVFGKVNSDFVLRTGIGRFKELYSIFDKNSVAIGYFWWGGVACAFLKPIYYEVVERIEIINNVKYIYISDKKFDYSIHQVSDIYGRSSFFKGIDETKLIPGITINTGIRFNFAEKYEHMKIIETGIIIDIFSKPVQIMFVEPTSISNNKNNGKFIFTSLYIAYRFGKIKFWQNATTKNPLNTEIQENENNQ
ncbi:MAG: hypothetical protein N3A01_04315 [Bacteroidales bacterium]|nr:hypothetical protein [Bacteroidales bacterium]